MILYEIVSYKIKLFAFGCLVWNQEILTAPSTSFFVFSGLLSLKEDVPELLEGDHGVSVDVGLNYHLLEVVLAEVDPEPREDKLDLRGWDVAVTILKEKLGVFLSTLTSVFVIPCQRPWRPAWDPPQSLSHFLSSPSGWQIQRSPLSLSRLCQLPTVFKTNSRRSFKINPYIDDFLELVLSWTTPDGSHDRPQLLGRHRAVPVLIR